MSKNAWEAWHIYYFCVIDIKKFPPTWPYKNLHDYFILDISPTYMLLATAHLFERSEYKKWYCKKCLWNFWFSKEKASECSTFKKPCKIIKKCWLTRNFKKCTFSCLWKIQWVCIHYKLVKERGYFLNSLKLASYVGCVHWNSKTKLCIFCIIIDIFWYFEYFSCNRHFLTRAINYGPILNF